MSGLHARIGPSSLKRTINCPGSVRELETLERRSNNAADEGSCLHAYVEDVLRDDLDPYDLIGKTYQHNGYNLTITADHAECVLPAIDWIRSQPFEEMLIEVRVNLDPWMPEQFGTADLILIFKDENGDWWVVVFDWKFGVGVPVKVADNPQLKAYALGVLHTVLRPRGIQPRFFRLIIEQPRNHEGGRFWEPWDISYDDLMEFGETLKATYRAVMDPNAPCIAGTWCKETFCDVMNRPQGCGAYDNWMLDLLSVELDELDYGDSPTLPNTEVMTPARRAVIVRHADLILAWLAQLHERSMDAAKNGQPDPGLKLVAGRKGNRFFVDEESAEMILVACLGDRAFTRKLISISEAEKIFKPGRRKQGNPVALELLTNLVDQPDGKPILVDATDPRPEIQTYGEMLEDLEDLD